MKKLRLTIDGKKCVLELDRKERSGGYRLTGAVEQTGTASIEAAGDGRFSVLIGDRSYTVTVLQVAGGLEAWIGNKRYVIEISDLRDRPAGGARQSLAGPFELRALMPGRVVKVLVAPGEKVTAGQSLIVVEAMKMQNEMKSPKDGAVTKIHVQQGATVGAGERLMLVE